MSVTFSPILSASEEDAWAAVVAAASPTPTSPLPLLRRVSQPPRLYAARAPVFTDASLARALGLRLRGGHS